jgi:hypothetical protein
VPNVTIPQLVIQAGRQRPSNHSLAAPRLSYPPKQGRQQQHGRGQRQFIFSHPPFERCGGLKIEAKE